MDVLKSVLEKNADLTNKEKMALVANVFQTHRQIGESEAFFKLIPNLKLKDSNVTTQWLSLGTQDEVTKRLKKNHRRRHSFWYTSPNSERY